MAGCQTCTDTPTGRKVTGRTIGSRTLSGSLVSGSGGIYTLHFTAHNGIASDAVQTVTLTVNEPPSIVGPDRASFTVGSFGAVFIATGHSYPAAPTLTAVNNLPANSGITFHDNGEGIATISGTPVAGSAGVYTFTITAHNGVAPDATRTFTLTINPAPELAYGPQVLGVQRLGYHTLPTSLVLNFSEALDPARAQTLANYQLTTRVGRRLVTIPIASATYLAGTQSVVLRPARLLALNGTYTLTVVGSAPGGLTDVTGDYLCGAGTGHPGTNFTTSITRRNFVYTPPSRSVPTTTMLGRITPRGPITLVNRAHGRVR